MITSRLVETMVTGSAVEATSARKELRPILDGPCIKEFNVQETVWHTVLMREQFAASGKLDRPTILKARRALFEKSQWGPRGIDGMKMF